MAFELAYWRFASPLVPRGGSGMWAEEARWENPEYYVTSVWVGVRVSPRARSLPGVVPRYSTRRCQQNRCDFSDKFEAYETFGVHSTFSIDCRSPLQDAK